MDFVSKHSVAILNSDRTLGRKRRGSTTCVVSSPLPMVDNRVVDAVVRAVLAQLRVDEAPCGCHSAPAGCCPDRMGLLVHHGASRFGLQAGATQYPREIARLIDHTLLKPDATRQ